MTPSSRTTVQLLIAGLIIFSPLWISLLTFWLARRHLFLTVAVCALQFVLAYAVWWFFWSHDGYGGVAREGQLFLLAALLPVAVAWRRRRSGGGV